MAEQNQGTEHEDRNRQDDDQRRTEKGNDHTLPQTDGGEQGHGNDGLFNQQGIPSNQGNAGNEGGSFRGQGSYGYQGGYDEQGDDGTQRNDSGQEGKQAGSQSGYETGYQGGKGGEYPSYGDEGSFGGASDRRSTYEPTSGQGQTESTQASDQGARQSE